MGRKDEREKGGRGERENTLSPFLPFTLLQTERRNVNLFLLVATEAIGDRFEVGNRGFECLFWRLLTRYSFGKVHV